MNRLLSIKSSWCRWGGEKMQRDQETFERVKRSLHLLVGSNKGWSGQVKIIYRPKNNLLWTVSYLSTVDRHDRDRQLH